MSDGRAPWMADVLADAFRGVHGFRVTVHPQFQTLGKSSFYPRGCINHHTGGGTATFESQQRYIATGSSISPLANWMTSRPRDGVVTVALIASGKANHAGRGHLDWTGTDRGNNYAIGGEHQNDGRQPWPSQQVEAIRMGTAAFLTHLGVDVDRMADHKTYAPGRKVDRHSTDLDAERWAVRSLMDTSSKDPTMNPYIAYLKTGMGGEGTDEYGAVLFLQRVLASCGATLNVDGVYGSQTAAAVESVTGRDGRDCNVTDWAAVMAKLAEVKAARAVSRHLNEATHAGGGSGLTEDDVRRIAAEVVQGTTFRTTAE